jgi:hypothetical protein
MTFLMQNAECKIQNCGGIDSPQGRVAANADEVVKRQ